MNHVITTQLVKERILHNYNGGIQLVSECNHSKQIVTLKCTKCGFVWNANIAHYIRTDFTQSPCKNCRHQNAIYSTTCESCGKKIIKFISSKSQSGKDYCSMSCSAKQRNRLWYIDHPSTKPIAQCAYCWKQLGKTQKKFCNNLCQQQYYYENYIDDWLNGKQTGLVGQYQISQRVRKYMIDKAGNKCQECGWDIVNEYTGVVPLQVHHIDGNYRNNSVQNLKVLCPCCHALTPTYRGLNRGNGREQRCKTL